MQSRFSQTGIFSCFLGGLFCLFGLVFIMERLLTQCQNANTKMVLKKVCPSQA